MSFREGEIRGGSETVLLVSPDPEVRTLAAFMLARLGYCVLEARSATEALRVYEQHDGTVHLLLAEALMSRINGHDLADALRVRNGGLRIVFLADAPYERMARRVAARRRLFFLVRPFTMVQLAAKVREALDAPIARAQAAG